MMAASLGARKFARSRVDEEASLASLFALVRRQGGVTDPPSLHGVRMRVTSGAEAAAVSSDTVFEFEQTGNIFSARYRGGQIADGYLIGIFLSDGKLEFRYVQADRNGRIDAGVSTGALTRLPDGRLRLVENFRWSTRPESGQNVFEEANE